MIYSIAISFMVFVLGLYGIIRSRNIVKTIICLNIIQTSVIVSFILFSRSMGNDPPIFDGKNIVPVDPLPQALIITAIVIGASITALALMMTIKIFHYYGTLDWREIFERND